eukprot:1393502-Amorphochlora_amoeboformis.AAC.1
MHERVLAFQEVFWSVRACSTAQILKWMLINREYSGYEIVSTVGMKLCVRGLALRFVESMELELNGKTDAEAKKEKPWVPLSLAGGVGGHRVFPEYIFDIKRLSFRG